MQLQRLEKNTLSRCTWASANIGEAPRRLFRRTLASQRGRAMMLIVVASSESSGNWERVARGRGWYLFVWDDSRGDSWGPDAPENRQLIRVWILAGEIKVL